MARPRHITPTAGELEILKVLWQRGPSTVREVLDELNQTRRRAYTSVMTLLGVMVDKGLVARDQRGRAFIYQARSSRDKTLRRIVGDLLGRAFEGSASLLVEHLLDQSQPSHDELGEIRRAIDEYQRREDA